MAPPDVEPVTGETPGIAGWAHWWYWPIVLAILVAAFLYYPAWRLDHQWRQLRVGDSADRMMELLGRLPKPSYTVQSSTGASDAYVYTKYWKSYEVLVSPATQKVISKQEVNMGRAQY
jgi:hypothetical protein